MCQVWTMSGSEIVWCECFRFGMSQVWNVSGLEHVCLEFDWFRMCQFWNFPWCQKTTIFKKAENAFFPENRLTVLSAVLPSTQ